MWCQQIWASCSKACSISPALFEWFCCLIVFLLIFIGRGLFVPHSVVLRDYYRWYSRPYMQCHGSNLRWLHAKTNTLTALLSFWLKMDFFWFCFCLGSHPVMHTQQCTYNLDLPSRSHCGRLRGPFGILGSNPGQLHARQASYLQCYWSDTLECFNMI